MITRPITRGITSPIARGINAPPIGALNFNAITAGLFRNGEQGAAYDPSDLTTLFQDSAGTIHVTGPGQPIGLMLDKSSSARVVRRNLLTETEFRNGVADIAVRGGKVTATAFAGYAGGVAFGYDETVTSFAYKQSPHANGMQYTFSAFIRMDDGGVPDAGFSLTLFGINYSPSTVTHLGSGLYIVRRTATSSGTSPNFGLVKYPAQGARTFVVTGYQLELGGVASAYQPVAGPGSWTPGNHAFQATAASRPMLQQTPIRIDYDAVDDVTNTTFPASLGSACTVARSIPGVGAQILTGQTVGTTFTNNIDNCGMIIVNRALTPTETANITRLFNRLAGV